MCGVVYERAFACENNFKINEDAFNDTTRFKLIYDKVIAGERWMCMKLNLTQIQREKIGSKKG